MDTWLVHLELLKQKDLSEIWAFEAPHGIGKTSTLNGMLDAAEAEGFKVTDDLSKEADILHMDEIGSKAYKRRAMGTVNKALMEFFQQVRGLFPLTLLTVQVKGYMDIDLRENPIIEIHNVIRPGLLMWREPIEVVPRWTPKKEEIARRRKVAIRAQKELEKVDE